MNQTARKTPDDEQAANVGHERGQQRAQAGRLSQEQESEELDYDDEEDIQLAVMRLVERSRRRIREQPLTAASAAFIVGFAFGNGVPKFLARAGIAVGLRLVMERLFERAELIEDVD